MGLIFEGKAAAYSGIVYGSLRGRRWKLSGMRSQPGVYLKAPLLPVTAKNDLKVVLSR